MIKILITTLLLLFLKPETKVYQVTNDCNGCPLQTTVHFSGTGFTAKKWIALEVIWPDGFSQNFHHTYYPALQVPSSGEISFQFGLTSQVGTYTVNVYEVNGQWGGQWRYRATSTFNVQ